MEKLVVLMLGEKEHKDYDRFIVNGRVMSAMISYYAAGEIKWKMPA